MNKISQDFYGKGSIGKILIKIAPPVMLAQLIQALYNIVDSFFVGKYSGDALTALTVIYPMQLVIIAFAVGTGVGVNTFMARKYAEKRLEEADEAAGCGIALALATWVVFCIISNILLVSFVRVSATNELAIDYAVTYGRIICMGSIFSFLEGTFSKIHQAGGNMKLPMIAQVTGALVNVILDPILIFGCGFIPSMGVAGAAYATIIGQFFAAVITGTKGYRKVPSCKKLPRYVKNIYFYGYSSIVMQLLFTVYILVLNMILATFSDAAVTVLGLYYKLQSFFFIPLLGLQTCIIPLLSYNYAAGSLERCKRIMKQCFVISAIFMLIGMVMFIFVPESMIRLFSKHEAVLYIGKNAFPIIGTSFIPAVFSLMFPVCFQAIGYGKTSLLLSLTRQIFCLIPIFYGLSFIGVNYVWLAFPLSESITGLIGGVFYKRLMTEWNVRQV